MFYIINSNGECVAICDSSPDIDDLKLRGESVVESKEAHKIGCVYDGSVLKDPEETDAGKLYGFLSLVSSAIDCVNSVGLQCYMAGIDFPADWKAYRTELIALSKVSEYSDNLVLPTQPPLPSNI